MKTSSILKPALMAMLLAQAAQAEERAFDLEGFRFITLTGGLLAQVQTGPTFSVVAESDSADALEELDFRLDGTTLVLDRDQGFHLFSSDEPVTVLITLPDLAGFEASAGANMQVSGAETDSFDATLSSGANGTVNGLVARVVTAQVSSGAVASLNGQCGQLTASASSGAVLSADDLICDSITASASSGGNLTINASKSVEATASSGGIVSLSGMPSSVQINASSGGLVSQ